ncbi:MAG: bifunctional alpha,alpha-trehalose-phosphate synthase (UDP-forming)/trehalose-phosphatase, partial [Proteobacteria bacterium]
MQDGNLWFGWSGTAERLKIDATKKLDQEFSSHGCVPIEFPEKEHHAFLTEMCNGILWPLYHYQVGNLPLQFSGWDEYVEINRITAEKIKSVAKPGDTIWIQDYHFQLLPKMLREMNLEVKIGFFLHIPFPSYEIFRILPWRKEILKGLLGADVIGFHTSEYVDHFISAAKEILNLEVSGNHLRLVDRQVQVDHYPLGVDLSELSKPYAGESPAADDLRRVKAEHPELKFLLSVDRLDYTKGLARKLLAYEYLLDNNPELRGKLMLIQIAPPSRGDVPAYHEFRRQLDEHVGRINGKFATPAYQPIFYLTRSFHPQEIYQIYKDVDVMLVTPVRDGMNLVAKEFIASRDDNDGVLVLSEFAGASSELHEALMVNPYDINQMAKVFQNAVEMPKPERQSRMAALRERVVNFQTSTWAENILEQIRSMPETLHKQNFADPKSLAAEIAGKNKPLKIAL